MIKKRIKPHKYGKQSSAKNWNNKLTNVPCFILGNGPSLEHIDINLIEDFFSIGINRAFYKLDPTILMWQDIETWHTEKKKINQTKALKYCRDISDPNSLFYHFKLIFGEFSMPNNPLVLHGGGATGPLSFQLAYMMGCNPIILLGMDCCYSDEKTNFYGHNRFHSRHTLNNCNKGLKWIKTYEDKVKIINCSKNKVFEKEYDYKIVIEELKEQKKNRESLIKQIVS